MVEKNVLHKPNRLLIIYTSICSWKYEVSGDPSQTLISIVIFSHDTSNQSHIIYSNIYYFMEIV